MAEVPYSFPLLPSNQWGQRNLSLFLLWQLHPGCCLLFFYCSHQQQKITRISSKKLWPELKEVSTFKGERMIQPL